MSRERRTWPGGIARGVASVVLAVLTVEALCALLFNLVSWRIRFFDPTRFSPPQDQLAMLVRNFDPDLGWRSHHTTPFGERPRPVTYDRPLLSTFGDSFTYCDEVKDHESWQTVLAERLHADVYNFGNNAYGPDQAYLRFQQDFPKTRTPLVTLGFLIENINRLVNVYRKFYFDQTRIALTKPRFSLEAGQLRLLPNPIRRAEDITLLYDQGFREQLGQHDWWYNRHELPVLEFPYSRILFDKRLWMKLYHAHGSRGVDEVAPRPWENLWRDPEARALAEAIFDAFAHDAKAQGATPVLMLLPQHRDIEQRVRGGEPGAAAQIRAFCDQRGYLCFDGIEALARDVNEPEDIEPLYVKVHLSAAANARIAEAFHEFLRANGLVTLDVSSAPAGADQRGSGSLKTTQLSAGASRGSAVATSSRR